MRKMFSVAGAIIAVLTLVAIAQFGLIRPSIVVAHPGPHPPTPPTHDYDTVTPNTQPPISPLLAGAEARTLVTLGLGSFSAIVPLGELQAILPAGFTATELAPPGSGRATIGLNFALQERIERVGIGTFGPATRLLVFHLAQNIALNRTEILYLAAEYSDASAVSASDAILGPGSSRLADAEAEVEEKRGQLRMSFEVEDKAIGLKVRVRASGPAAIDSRLAHSDPTPLAVRGLNAGLLPNASQWVATMSDGRAVTITPGNFTLHAGGPGRDQLALPGGTVTILAVSPTFTFFRGYETFYKAEE